jgi:Ni,Fe-hydrogenase III large subunit
MEPDNNILFTLKNGQSLFLNDIPVFQYTDFSKEVLRLLNNNDNHCVNYFAFPVAESLQFIACIANDSAGNIAVLSHKLNKTDHQELDSLTAHHFPLHIFEREISENFGINFIGHPWLKPLRFPSNRANKSIRINDYPFYSVESEELHEVGVGPVHAGIIEPGHFRFTCNGETVLHLEIQLGWQHRGIENLMLQKKKLLQRTIFAENIAGDSVIGHTHAFVQVIESLNGIVVPEQLKIERSIALELERMAIHTSDISALCTDVAYNLGANVIGVLRTGIINFIQEWCGNRLGKSLIMTGGTHFPFTNELKGKLTVLLNDFEKRFVEISHRTFKLPSLENRFDEIGTVTEKQARSIGSVGMAARMTNVKRDIRETHPFGGFEKYPYKSIVLQKGDVFARFLLRRKEIKQSIKWIRNVLEKESFDQIDPKPQTQINFKPETFTMSLTEGWRGEICHCAVTDSKGELIVYKIKDPSMHNWKSLELSLRNLEISDFPINNKSYSLSYCGHDL